MQQESIESLMERLPVGTHIIRRADHWQFWQKGKPKSGSFSLRTLLEMEIGILELEKTSRRKGN